MDSEELEGGASEISVASTQIGTARVWAHFTNPPARSGDDRTILNEVVRLIDRTPAGETIHAAIHSMAANPVSDAIVRAKKRGVRVFVVQDGKNLGSGDNSPADIENALGANNVFCKSGTALGCVTNDGSGIMHTKLMLFSRTYDPEGTLRSNVSWFGSANMTYFSGSRTFNNTVSVYDDATSYQNFRTYFGHLFSRTHYERNDYYDPSARRGFWASTNANLRTYTSPEQDSDLVEDRLDEIIPDTSCRIRVQQSFINDSRANLVDAVVRLKKSGCRVWVVVGEIQERALAKFKAAGIPVRQHEVHDKVILVNSKFAGSTDNRRLIFTGSHNWSYSANYKNDEIFVRLESAALYGAFFTHFNDAYNFGSAL